jgi:hypothetical protein
VEKNAWFSENFTIIFVAGFVTTTNPHHLGTQHFYNNMKNILLVGFCLFVAGTCFAQRAHVIFAELGGNGGLGSINYDVRFDNGALGWGLRIGGGISPFGMVQRAEQADVIELTGGKWNIPILINYITNDKQPFEFGIGIVNSFFEKEHNKPHWRTNLTGALMYRRQLKDGINCRIGWTPVFIPAKKDDPWNNIITRLNFCRVGVSIGCRL